MSNQRTPNELQADLGSPNEAGNQIEQRTPQSLLLVQGLVEVLLHLQSDPPVGRRERAPW